MADIPAFLDQASDKFFILSTGHSMNGLDSIVEVNGNNVKMTQPIEDIVLDENKVWPATSAETDRLLEIRTSARPLQNSAGGVPPTPRCRRCGSAMVCVRRRRGRGRRRDRRGRDSG
jgi:hypothetical protein